MSDNKVPVTREHGEGGVTIKEAVPADQVPGGDRVTTNPTMADEEVMPPVPGDNDQPAEKRR